MKQRLLSVFVLVILLQITAVFAAPVVNSFTTKFVYPNHIQIEWDVSSTFDMRTLELYKEVILLEKQRKGMEQVTKEATKVKNAGKKTQTTKKEPIGEEKDKVEEVKNIKRKKSKNEETNNELVFDEMLVRSRKTKTKVNELH